MSKQDHPKGSRPLPTIVPYQYCCMANAILSSFYGKQPRTDRLYGDNS